MSRDPDQPQNKVPAQHAESAESPTTANEGLETMKGNEGPGDRGPPEDGARTGIPDDDDAAPFEVPTDDEPTDHEPTAASASSDSRSPSDAPPTQGNRDEALPDFRERAKLLPDHATWLERPSTIKLLKFGSLGLLAATVAAEAIFVPNPKAHFEGVDGWLGFHAVYGFVTCVLMVVAAKFVLGAALKRKDTYYDD